MLPHPGTPMPARPLLRVATLAALGLALYGAGRGLYAALPAGRGALVLASGAVLALTGTALWVLCAWRSGRRPEVLRPLLYGAACALGVQLAFLQPFTPPGFELALAGGGLAGALLVWLRRRCPERWRRRGDVVATNLLGFLCGLELALRLAAVLFPLSPLLVTTGSDRLAVYRLAPGSLYFGTTIGASGFHDTRLERAASGDTLVACIGDSFSTGVVPLSYHFTTLCEDSGFVVANLGAPAIGPAEYLRLVEEEALPRAPDAIAVQLFVGNDIQGLPVADWRRSVGDRQNLLLLQLPRRLLAAWRNRWLAEGTHRTARSDFPWLEDPSRELPTFSAGDFLHIERNRVRRMCSPEEAPFDALFEALEAIVAAAGDTPLGFVLLPAELQVDDALWAAVGGEGLVRDLPQQRIRVWAEERGLPLLDLLPGLRAVPPLDDGSRHLYHLRDTHFNARGNRATAAQLRPFLRRLVARGR